MHLLASYPSSPSFNWYLSPVLNPSYSCLAFFLLPLIRSMSSIFIVSCLPIPYSFSPITKSSFPCHPHTCSCNYRIQDNIVCFFQRKCDKYWPEEGLEQHGNIVVKHLNTFSRAHYTVRMFSLKDTKAKKVSPNFGSLFHYKIFVTYCCKILEPLFLIIVLFHHL